MCNWDVITTTGAAILLFILVAILLLFIGWWLIKDLHIQMIKQSRTHVPINWKESFKQIGLVIGGVILLFIVAIGTTFIITTVLGWIACHLGFTIVKIGA